MNRAHSATELLGIREHAQGREGDGSGISPQSLHTKSPPHDNSGLVVERDRMHAMRDSTFTNIVPAQDEQPHPTASHSVSTRPPPHHPKYEREGLRVLCGRPLCPSLRRLQRGEVSKQDRSLSPPSARCVDIILGVALSRARDSKHSILWSSRQLPSVVSSSQSRLLTQNQASRLDYQEA